MKVIIKNSELVFQRKHQKTIVYKNYWVRQEGQFIDLTSYSGVSTLLFNKTKYEVDVYLGATTITGIQCVISSRNYNNCINLKSVNSVGNIMAQNSGYSGSAVSFPITIGVHHLLVNNNTGTASYDNGEPQSFTAPGGSDLQKLWMFAHGTSTPTADSYQEGAVKVARVKMYNATNDTLLLDIRPALVDGVPCLYEAVNDVELYSEDETALVLE